VRLLQVDNVDITDIAVTMDDHVGTSFWAVELGGGNPDEFIAGRNVHIDHVAYVSGRTANNSGIGVQGGPYGPVNWYINVLWLYPGMTAPQSASYGDTTL
jgi:hypothetical protein